MSKIIRLISITIFVAVLVISCASLKSITTLSPEPKIKFGLMKKNSVGKFYVYSETRIIPFNLIDPKYRFGYEVDCEVAGHYGGYLIAYLPAPPMTIDAYYAKDNSPIEYITKDNGKIIQTETYYFDQYWRSPMYFNEGDPLGDWKFEIYINNSLKEVIEFKVVQ